MPGSSGTSTPTPAPQTSDVSGFAGILRLDGRSVRDDEIDPLAAAIRHRGPDRTVSWTRGVVGLAHADFPTTPEALTECQPLRSGALTIVADIRLDNRDELLPALGVRDPSIGDAELALRAYAAWGASCAGKLDGDFAFAIWDASAATLFAARDPFGVKPFVYAIQPGALVAFGSEAQAVLACPGIPRDVDEQRIADFLVLRFRDAERTFYQSVRRLPGGSTLTIVSGRITVDRYWSLERVSERRDRGRDRDDRYADEYRHHFTRAVHARMRSTGRSSVGALLSGGLDSSAVACVARDEHLRVGAGPLPVFSWRFSDCLDADERAYQEAVVAAGGLRPITLDSAACDASPWTGLQPLLANGPVYATNHYLNGIAARRAGEIGVRILLDGLGGDAVVSMGRARYRELFLRGRWWTLSRELRAAAERNPGPSALRLWRAFVAGPLLPSWVVAWRRQQAGVPDPADIPPLLAPRLHRLVVRERPRVPLSTREEHLAQLAAPLAADGLELFDRIMARNESEGRYPFFDRRLAEFCVSLPGDQKLAGGYSRIVARRAMAGIVPDAVRWRTGKGAPGLHILKALRDRRAELDDLFVRDSSALEPYVDIDALRREYQAFLTDRATPFHAVIRLWSAAALGYWLRQRAS